MKRKKKIVLEELVVESYAAEGKSLARRDGKVIFIEGAVPGDVVDVRLSKNKKDWAEGHPVHFRTYAADRVTPFCQHFGVCGGCQWQMLPYNKQTQYKQQQVLDNLNRIGKIPLPATEPIAGAEETRFYRNKLEYTFSTKEFTPAPPPPKEAPASRELSSLENLSPSFGDTEETSFDNGGALGFHAKGFFDKIVQIEKCWLQPEPTNELRNAIHRYAKEHGYSYYNFREHKGLLRNLQLRICRTGEVMANLVFGENNPGEIKNILAYIKETFPQLTTLLYTINLKMNDSLFDQTPVVYYGKGYVIEKLEDFSFKIGPKSFFQTNTAQAERLYRITRDFAELDGSQIVYDLYCGTGSIGIFCSRGARKLVGVELIAEAIADARENALHNGIAHAHFFAGDVTDICDDDFFAAHGRPDVIITDPPRAGMHAGLTQKILDIAAPLVVYVSCNPATQARDLALLDQKYKVTRLQPVDMFPHTHHIENVVQLKLKEGVFS